MKHWNLLIFFMLSIVIFANAQKVTYPRNNDLSIIQIKAFYKGLIHLMNFSDKKQAKYYFKFGIRTFPLDLVIFMGETQRLF